MDANNENTIPFEINELKPDVAEEFNKYYKGTSYVTVGPKKYLFQNLYKEISGDIYNFKLRSDDVFVLGYPRSGTTLTQEMVWLIYNDLNFEKARTTETHIRCPILESKVYFDSENPSDKPKFSDQNQTSLFEALLRHPRELEKIASPRVIKSHIPLSLLPPHFLDTVKVVNVARDPRDAAVSFYNFLKHRLQYDCDLKPFFDLFMKDQVTVNPYFAHVKEAWSQRYHPNMLFLFYEDMLKDLPSVVRRVAQFLGKQYTDEQFAELCDHLHFDNIKKNKQFNFNSDFMKTVFKVKDEFVRKGKAGGWRDYFDEEMTIKGEKWMAENLRDTDLRYPSII